MPSGGILLDVIERLKETPAESFRSTCVEILSARVDWAAASREHLAVVADDVLAAGVKKISVPGVEPKTFLLHDEPGRFRLVLNHFDQAAFATHFRDGRITAHHHHFDFVTRVINGSYHHMLFGNSGDVTRPKLFTRYRDRDESGHVYALPWDEFHCVLAPAPDTMSLQIRTTARFRVSHREPDLTTKDVLNARDVVMDALDDVPPNSVAGLVPEFANCWL